MEEVKRIGNLYGEDRGTGFAGNVWDKDGISPTITTMQGGGREPMIIDTINDEVSEKMIVAMRGRNPERPTDRTPGIHTEQRLEMNKDGLVNTLTTVQKDNLCLEIKQATKEGSIKCKVGGCYDASFPSSTTRRGRVQEGGDITPTITAQGGENINFVEGINYEKEKRISKVLCILRSKIGTESFSEWAIRGLYCFLKKEVLRQRMYAKIILENWRKSTDLGQFTSDCKVDKSTATPEEELRDLWKDWEARCTSYRRQLSEQQYGQLKNYMQELSYENTPTENILLCLWEASEGVGILRKALSEIQEIWESDVDEQRTQTRYRIRKLTPRETWRLMGYTDEDFEKAAAVNSNTQLYKEAGNAIVKQVLMAIFSQML